MKNEWRVLVGVCAVVVGIYAYMAESGAWESMGRNAADDYYNLLVRGFRAGHLSLNKEVPPALTQLADPYDPTANAPYQFAPYWMLDLSYYKGRLFLYWGVTPVFLLFWPFVALTGHYLFHSRAVIIFCVVGFLASVGLLRGLWRRYFAEVSVGVVAVCALVLGLATGLPVILSRSQVYEVPVSCGYMLTMLALGATWRAIHEPERSCRWLAAGSTAYGLAVGARPSLLFGAVILLVPVAQAWRERRKIWSRLVAATGPIMLIGLGLMLYNNRRFDSPFEFGVRYQLAPVRAQEYFNLRYLWFNFRVDFLQPARWSNRFPFVHDIVAPPLPAGYGSLQTPFGVLTNIPVVWLALAVPLAWRGRAGPEASTLRWCVTAVALLAGICAMTIGTFFAASMRYEVEFLPALVLLAVVGILGLERTLAPTSESGLRCLPVWRCAVRWGWGMLAGFSVAFNLLATANYFAEGHAEVGTALLQAGRIQEAVKQYEQALRIKPDYSQPYNNLGAALVRLGRVEEGIERYEQALQLDPDCAEAHYNLGVALDQRGKIQEAIGHFKEAVRIKPEYAEAQNNLGSALLQTGQVEDAIGHLRQAVRLRPDYAVAHHNLGLALVKEGSEPEAIQQYEKALRISPDYAEAHFSLGNALLRANQVPEAVGEYELALRAKSDYAQAHTNLGLVLAGLGRFLEASEHWEQVVRLRPGDPEAHYRLGVCLEKIGRVCDGITQYEEALRLDPDLTTAQNDLAWSLATHTPREGGDPVRAVTLAQEICARAGNRVPTYLDTLAAGYAATGRFNDACATAEKAIELAHSDNQRGLAARVEARLKLYQSGRAYYRSDDVTQVPRDR